MLTILPDLYAKPWDPAYPDQHWFPTLNPAVALSRRFDTDAMLLPYWVEERNGDQWQPLDVAPRLRKSDLAAFAARGFRVRLCWGVLDIDCRDAHAGKAEASPDWLADARARAHEAAPGCVTYATRAGLRVLWHIGHDVSPDQWEVEVARAHMVFDAIGLPADRLPWNQPMRLPRVRREGVDQDRHVDPGFPRVWVPRPKTAMPAAATPPEPQRRERFRVPSKVAAGERHGMLKSLAASLRAQSMERQEILDALLDTDARVCDPPVQSERGGRRELEKLADHFDRLPPGPSAPPPDDGDDGDGGPQQVPMERGDAADIAAKLLEVLREMTSDEQGATIDPVFCDGKIWLYSRTLGIWQELNEDFLIKRVMALAGWPVFSGRSKDGTRKTRPLTVSQAVWRDGIRALQASVSSPGFFDDATAGVVLGHSFAAVEKGRVTHYPHDPQWRARAAYDFDWTDEPPTMWLEFLRQCFEPLGEEDRRTTIRILSEAIGAGLIGVAHLYERMLNFLGGGSNGKSVQVEVMAACFPPGTVAWMAPHELAQGYNAAELVGKRLVVCTEIPATHIDQLTAATIKRIVSGERLMARRIYQSPFEFSPRVLVCGALNALPKVADESDGFFRRQLLVAWLRKFLASEQNPELAVELVEVDRARIVCWCVRAAATLMDRGHYEEPKSSLELVSEWRKGLDPIRQFVEDALEPSEDGTPNATLYQQYRAWATRGGYTPLDSSTFWRRLSPLVQSRYGSGWFGSKTRREKRYKVKVIEGQE